MAERKYNRVGGEGGVGLKAGAGVGGCGGLRACSPRKCILFLLEISGGGGGGGGGCSSPDIPRYSLHLSVCFGDKESETEVCF